MEKEFIGKKVIIRSDRAGVFYGTLAETDPCGDKLCVKLTQCRRLWYWDGAASLSQLAVDGTTAPRSCKFTMSVTEIVVLGVIEIIPCTEIASSSIENVGVWKR